MRQAVSIGRLRLDGTRPVVSGPSRSARTAWGGQMAGDKERGKKGRRRSRWGKLGTMVSLEETLSSLLLPLFRHASHRPIQLNGRTNVVEGIVGILASERHAEVFAQRAKLEVLRRRQALIFIE